ncbi:peptidoglycan recognition protein [Streptomyces sp. ISL-66]|uniref:peptidoglycan recognition protein family protein n=1 Tax=Streptomyces sp. ISL-66 TaxID=2819186 RepID=UPI001BE69ED8|nr:peptidoglycan recognition protein [Streptomyces sp. ISL-66]MBT2467584.1 peptidoglycan recognition protein [Streptomyces sp. ISL-66]
MATALGVAAVLGFQGMADGTEGSAGGKGPGEAKAFSADAEQTGPVDGETYTLAVKPKGKGEAVVSQQGTDLFGLLGVSWTDPAAKVTGTIEARSRSAETGKWSRWIALDPVRPGLDGKRPGEHGATEPVWVGPSNGAEVRVKGGELPAGLELKLVDPGTAGSAKKKGRLNADPAAFATTTATPGPASTAPQPKVVTRAEWNADESMNSEGPIYLPGSKIKAVFVHHTADAAAYDCSQSEAIVRAIHKFHVETNKWRDLGYNFLVDKCGTIFEGRQGGIDQPVMGAHTYGWNSESTSVAVLGDYTASGVSDAAREAVSQIAAYKLGQYDGDMNGTTQLVAGVDQTNYFHTSFKAGTAYTFKTVSGHRDGYNTECPGDSFYPQLDSIRTSGPAARLKIATVNGTAAEPNGSYKSTGALSVDWSTSTDSGRISKFDLLVDGVSAVSTSGAGRTASTGLSNGTHKVQVQATTANGKVSTSLPVTVVATVPVSHDAKFVPVAPKRLMDTRIGLGVPQAKVGPQKVVTLPVAGANGIPGAGVTAVILNVTATNPTGNSFVSVYPSGTARSSASNLNVTPGLTIPNLVVVPVVDGKVSFYNNDGTVDLIADITGYFTSADAGSTHVSFGPKRLMDTRAGLGVRQAKVGPQGVVTLQVAGANGIPASGVTAVILNVTATNPTGNSYVAVYPSGTTRSSASNLNFTPGKTIPNLVVVPVVDGKVSFYNNDGTVDLIADITGYFTSADTGATHVSFGPKRLMDTRAGLGVRQAKVGAQGVVTLQVAGANGIPATGVTAVILNVTATNPTGNSYVAVYPSGTTRSSASNLNFSPGQTIPNLVVVPVVDGKVSFYNNDGSVDLIADITGYFAK